MENLNQEEGSIEYEPVGILRCCGYELLFMVPVVGLIVFLVLSFGKKSNKNLNTRNLARSYLGRYIVLLVLIIGVGLYCTFAG